MFNNTVNIGPNGFFSLSTTILFPVGLLAFINCTCVLIFSGFGVHLQGLFEAFCYFLKVSF